MLGNRCTRKSGAGNGNVSCTQGAASQRVLCLSVGAGGAEPVIQARAGEAMHRPQWFAERLTEMLPGEGRSAPFTLHTARAEGVLGLRFRSASKVEPPPRESGPGPSSAPG